MMVMKCRWRLEVMSCVLQSHERESEKDFEAKRGKENGGNDVVVVKGQTVSQMAEKR